MNMPLVHPHDDGIRPAGSPKHCFYCRQAVGTPHLESCVVVTKIVSLRMTIEIEKEVPYCWTDAQIVEHEMHEG
jgi:hypothetical protein